MQRRDIHRLTGLSLLLWAVPTTSTWSQGLTPSDALKGVRAALSAGARTAVEQLGQANGFMGNPKVRIPLPGILEDVAPLLKATGQGKRLDELVLAMNQAAERAVPLTANQLQQAVAHLDVRDAHAILTGGDTSVTQFFADKTREVLTQQLQPLVKKATDQVQLANKYEAVAGKAAKLGWVKREDADLPGYVTHRALDGLYAVIAEEERKLRSNPAKAGSELLKKVFGALG